MGTDLLIHLPGAGDACRPGVHIQTPAYVCIYVQPAQHAPVGANSRSRRSIVPWLVHLLHMHRHTQPAARHYRRQRHCRSWGEAARQA
eukprot:363978-Chlamydomonas_euryale.AAC.3